MKERFKVLDIFRGLFSSLVVFFHMSAFTESPVIHNKFITNSDLFVDFFFVLSGFVIAYSYQSMVTGTELRTFFKKRFFRLYPLHFIVLILFVGIEASKHFASAYVQVNKIDNASNNLTTFFTNLFLLNSIKLPGVHDVSWNIASWSISAEMIAYFVFGFTIVGINRGKLASVKNIIYLVIIAAAGMTMYIFTGGFELTYNFDYGFLRSIVGFFTGVICFNVYRANSATIRQWGNGIFHILEPLCLVVALVMVGFGDTFKGYGFIYEALFFITILTFALEKGWLSALLNKSGLLHNMGKYSYSIYMVHTLLLSLFNIAFIRILKLPSSAYSWLFIVNYAVIYAVSSWTFKHIEMHFNLSGKREGKKSWWLW